MDLSINVETSSGKVINRRKVDDGYVCVGFNFGEPAKDGVVLFDECFVIC